MIVQMVMTIENVWNLFLPWTDADRKISFRGGKYKLSGQKNKTRMSYCYLIPDDPGALSKTGQSFNVF